MPGEGRGNGPKQHTITSHVFKCHSLITPPGTFFFVLYFLSRWGDNAGPPEATNRSLSHRMCTEGVFATPYYTFRVTLRGWRKRNHLITEIYAGHVGK